MLDDRKVGHSGRVFSSPLACLELSVGEGPVQLSVSGLRLAESSAEEAAKQSAFFGVMEFIHSLFSMSIIQRPHLNSDSHIAYVHAPAARGRIPQGAVQDLALTPLLSSSTSSEAVFSRNVNREVGPPQKAKSSSASWLLTRPVLLLDHDAKLMAVST